MVVHKHVGRDAVCRILQRASKGARNGATHDQRSKVARQRLRDEKDGEQNIRRLLLQSARYFNYIH